MSALATSVAFDRSGSSGGPSVRRAERCRRTLGIFGVASALLCAGGCRDAAAAVGTSEVAPSVEPTPHGSSPKLRERPARSVLGRAVPATRTGDEMLVAKAARPRFPAALDEAPDLEGGADLEGTTVVEPAKGERTAERERRADGDARDDEVAPPVLRAGQPLRIRADGTHDTRFGVTPDGARIVELYDEDQEGEARLEIRRASDGRLLTTLDYGDFVSGDDEQMRSTIAQANALLAKYDFRVLKQLGTEDFEPDDPTTDEPYNVWPLGPESPAGEFRLDHGRAVRYDPNTGGFAVLDEEGDALAQTLIRAVDLEEEEPGERMIPDLVDLSVSEDGRTLVATFGTCACECLIEPFVRIFQVRARE